MNMPIEMTFTPCASGGMIMSSTWVGPAASTPSMRGHRVAVDVGVDDADLQALLRPSPRARLTVTDDLPTPPLPEAMA